MTPIEIGGVGFWSPGFADATALASGRRDNDLDQPSPSFGNKRHLRFTSDLTKMAICAFEQAIAGVELALDEINVVFASSQGEIQIAVELLDKIAEQGSTSPARFMNSVHNTVCGHISIGAKSHGAFTAVAGSHQTVSGAFIEAYCQLSTGTHDNVVLIVGDERLPPPVDLQLYDSMAMALLLRRGESEGNLPRVTGIKRDDSVASFTSPDLLAKNPCAPALGVLAALAEQRSGLVRLDGAGGEGWCAELAF